MEEKGKDNKVLHKIAAWIPTHISGKVIVGIYHMLDFFNHIKRNVIAEHRETNIKRLKAKDSPLGNKYIENQYAWKNIAFGKTNMSVAGCEIMAVYNVLKALNMGEGPELISELISEFERKGAALKGAIGSSPLAIRKYLNKKGISTRLIWKNEDINPDIKMAIATLYNDKASLYHQIHTIAFIKDEDYGFVPHNARHSKPGYETLVDALEAVGTDPKTICILEIL